MDSDIINYMDFTNNVEDYYWSFEDMIGQGKLSKVYNCSDMSQNPV